MEERRLTLIEHLDELRKRIIIISLAVIAGSIFSYFYVDLITDFIIYPAGELEFIYLSPPELFLAYIKMSVIVGLIIASPMVLFQIWMFVMPGLNKKERLYLLLALFIGGVFFLAGAAFAYFVIIPLTIQFFVKMTHQQIEPLFSFASYVSFVSSILFSFGITFELPLLIVLLTQLNLLTPKILKKSRKFIILIIFVVAAILTPPDVISQVLLAAPMIFLLELSILVSSIINRKKARSC